jgi:hypothetical protein
MLGQIEIAPLDILDREKSGETPDLCRHPSYKEGPPSC